ncbi:MAG: hypothetical protein RR645_02005 [Clostridium sp.]
MPNSVSLAGIKITLVAGYPKCVDNIQTWKYSVTFTEGPPTPGISDFSFQLCNPEHNVTNFIPGVADGGVYDAENAQPCLASEYGATRQIKWNRNNDNVVGEYEFSLVGCFKSCDINIAVKAGSPCNYGVITGPCCTPETTTVRGIDFSKIKY